MSSITDQVRLNRHHLFTRPRDNTGVNNEYPGVTTEQWEEDVRHALSFGQLLRSKVAPLGAQPGQQATERLWHAPDSPARQVLLGTIAPPLPYELTAYNLGAIMADLYPATHYQEYQYASREAVAYLSSKRPLTWGTSILTPSPPDLEEMVIPLGQ
ncbi:MAG: hypothetical protein LQ341_006811 [Variospora aurantia]|nr:MAG: hypothetical protein LQ341_006811 [Variospora aurantia]